MLGGCLGGSVGQLLDLSPFQIGLAVKLQTLSEFVSNRS